MLRLPGVHPVDHLPTSKLSPKNQVTLPRHLEVVRVLEEGSAVWAVPMHLSRPGGTERFPVLRIFTEAGKSQREREILADEALPREARLRLVTLLNGTASRMTVDKQNRVVLPAQQVAHLRAQEELYIFESNGALMVWTPGDWERYAQADSDELSAWLL